MIRHTLLYGAIAGVLIALLQWTQYRFLVLEYSLEIYGGLTALIFAVVGIWLGVRISSGSRAASAAAPPLVVPPSEAVAPGPSPSSEVEAPAVAMDEQKREEVGLTRRELEILEQIALGLSNREIAEKLFVSESTVKTHSSRLFQKLGAKRRTQAVQLGQELGLLTVGAAVSGSSAKRAISAGSGQNQPKV